MDLEVQGRIKEIAEKYGPENIVVILATVTQMEHQFLLKPLVTETPALPAR